MLGQLDIHKRWNEVGSLPHTIHKSLFNLKWIIDLNVTAKTTKLLAEHINITFRCCCSVIKSCLTLSDLWTAISQAFLSFTIAQSLLKLMSTELMMTSYHLILCCHLLFLPSISFPMSWFLTSGGQRIGASHSASVLPVNFQGWFPLGLAGLISLLSKRLSRIFSSTTIWKHQFFSTQPSISSNSHICTWLLEKS